MTKGRLFTFASLAYLTFVGVLAAYIHKPVSVAISEKIAIVGETPGASASQLSISDHPRFEASQTGTNRQSISYWAEVNLQQNSGNPVRALRRESWTTNASVEKSASVTMRESSNSSRGLPDERQDTQPSVCIAIPSATARASFSTSANTIRSVSALTGNAFRYQGGVAAVQESTEPPDAFGSPPELLITVAPDQQEDEPAVAAPTPTRCPLIPIEQEVFRAKWGQAAYDAARNAAAQEGRQKMEIIR